MSAARQVARLAVTPEDVEPAVLRRLDVPLGLRLDRLHLALQAAMGWTDSHLYAFNAGSTEWGVPDPEPCCGARSAAAATLRDVIEGTGAKMIRYLYDYGDCWDHAIRIERVHDPEPGRLHPRLIGLQGRCPPEDVGGPPGYAAFLTALADPAHEDHEHLRSWAGGGFDPDAPDLETIVADLARKRAPRPRKAKAAPPSQALSSGPTAVLTGAIRRSGKPNRTLIVRQAWIAASL